MDPTTCLARVRALASKVRRDVDMPESAEELAEAIGNLDDWITYGGFLPEQWAVTR